MEPVMHNRTLARVLLVEDDPTSRAFLAAAVARTPAEVDGADSLAAALVLAAAQRYDLWLFDAQLPDGSGIELLQRLRARDTATPALAHTACTEAATHAALLSAGFGEVLVKPLPAQAVRSAIRRALGLVPGDAGEAGMPSGPAPLWDDDSAARALNGNHAHVRTLRELFLRELPQARERVLEALRGGDLDSAGQQLHKLRASCGFVGACRLAAAVHALQRQPDDAALRRHFDDAARATAISGEPAG